MTDEIVVQGREDYDGDHHLLQLMGMEEEEEDHTVLWDNINPLPLVDDLGSYLHMDGPDSSFNSSPSLSTTPALPPNSTHPSAASLSMDQIEEFLLTDDHLRNYDPSKIDDFLSDILLDSPLPLTDLPCPSSSCASSHLNKNIHSQSPLAILGPQFNHPDFLSPNVSDDSSPPRDLQQTSPPLSLNSQPQPHTKDSSEHPELEQPSPPHSNDSRPQLEEDPFHDHEDAGDDPITKKRKRQLRNRDAALRSRERKKMYVRDLEIKSRHFESECRRLGMLLQCYLVENHALRLSLHNNSQAFAASATKQESAVLLLESLLLGSLLWLLGVIGLAILPKQLLSILGAALVGAGKNLGRLAPREAGSSRVDGTVEIHQSYMMSRRWRGSRRKMRCWVVAKAMQSLRDACLLELQVANIVGLVLSLREVVHLAVLVGSC